MLFVRTKTKTADFLKGCYVTTEKSYAVASERGLTAASKDFDEDEKISYRTNFFMSEKDATAITDAIVNALCLHDMTESDIAVVREYVLHVLDNGLLVVRK